MEKTQTDAEFIAAREAEAAAEFSAAVAEWREEKAAGKGQPKIVDKGGDFGSNWISNFFDEWPASCPTLQLPKWCFKPIPDIYHSTEYLIPAHKAVFQDLLD